MPYPNYFPRKTSKSSFSTIYLSNSIAQICFPQILFNMLSLCKLASRKLSSATSVFLHLRFCNKFSEILFPFTISFPQDSFCNCGLRVGGMQFPIFQKMISAIIQLQRFFPQIDCRCTFSLFPKMGFHNFLPQVSFSTIPEKSSIFYGMFPNH